MDFPDDLHKPVVLITGAAGGLGKALVRQFMSHDWMVIATDNRELSLAEFLKEEFVRVMNMNVTSDLSVKTVFDNLVLQNIQLDLIINNAGIDRYFPLSEAPADDFINVFNVNVFGAYRVNQTFLPILRSPGGRIIHIGSESLHLKIPFMPYPLSKNLLESYSRALRLELGFLDIAVVTVRPGAIRTSLLDGVSGLIQQKDSWKLDRPFQKFASLAAKLVGHTITADKAAEYIYMVSQQKRPRAVYRINNKIKLKLAALLPQSLLEKIIKRILS